MIATGVPLRAGPCRSTPTGSTGGRTRVFLRLWMGPVRHTLLARIAGELLDVLTVTGMAAGLRERLAAGQAR